MLDDIEYLRVLLNAVSFDSILIINSEGELKRVYCPFVVKARCNLPHIAEGDIFTIEKTSITENSIDVYIIKNNAYYTIYFLIL
jgi:hypothetical protein